MSTKVPPSSVRDPWYSRWTWVGYDGTYPLWRRILIFAFWVVLGIVVLLTLISMISKIAEATRLNQLNPSISAPNASIPPATSPPASAPPPTASPTTIPSASPSPTRCVSPAEPASGKIGLVQKQPASDTSWMSNFKGTAVTRIVYDGVPSDAETLKRWADAAACNGMSAEIRTEKVSGGAGALQGANTVNALCWDDWPATAKCHGDYLPVYLPYPEPNDYGTVGKYADVGRAASSGWAAVQAFGWRDAIDPNKVQNPDPAEADFVNRMNFSGYPAPSRPTPDRVGEFARMLHDNGVSNILIYTEYPAAGDVAYLRDCVSQVAAVLGR